MGRVEVPFNPEDNQLPPGEMERRNRIDRGELDTGQVVYAPGEEEITYWDPAAKKKWEEEERRKKGSGGGVVKIEL